MIKKLIIYEKEIDMSRGITNVSDTSYKERVMQKMKAVGLLKRSNKKPYAKLMASIREQFSFKIDVFPITLNDA